MATEMKSPKAKALGRDKIRKNLGSKSGKAAPNHDFAPKLLEGSKSLRLKDAARVRSSKLRRSKI